MRLWSIHPSALDRQGLLAAWREGLMAQSVVRRLENGEKPGYRNHPQLRRFLASPVPMLLIGTWLTFIYDEACYRVYSFNYSKIIEPGRMFKLTVTDGQLEYEFGHLLDKLKERSPDYYSIWHDKQPIPHPMFEVLPGEIEEWEKIDRKEKPEEFEPHERTKEDELAELAFEEWKRENE